MSDRKLGNNVLALLAENLELREEVAELEEALSQARHLLDELAPNWGHSSRGIEVFAAISAALSPKQEGEA